MTAVDLFAGLGGFSQGARLAGLRVAWAANHWRAAVEIHSNNHPETAHVCQDLQQADWSRVPAHDVLMASPACQGHSRARGVNRPHHDACRSTAWAVVACAEYHRPPVCLVENVPEFLRWQLFPAWTDALQRLGYAVQPSTIDAADCGVPQNRRRVFIVCTRGRAGLRLRLPARPHVPASAILDAGDGWTPVATKCERTRARVAEGRRLHGERFLVAYYGNERGGRSLNRPIGTITTRDRYALIDGDQMRMLNVSECRLAMGFPDGYLLPASSKLAKHMLGNAVCPPVARDILTELKHAA